MTCDTTPWQLTGEKEVFASRLREEKYNADKEHHMALSEALKTQAQVKAEMVAMVARLQVSGTICFMMDAS